MHKYILTLLLITAAYCSSAFAKDATVEEKIITGTFINYQSTLIYDEVCNKAYPKNRYNFDKPENVNLIGNEQMLAARLGGLIKIRLPEASVDDVVNRMVVMSKEIKAKIAEQLNKLGCDSAEAKQTEASLKLFSTLHPSQLHQLIDKQIIENGGTITPVEDIEN